MGNSLPQSHVHECATSCIHAENTAQIITIIMIMPVMCVKSDPSDEEVETTMCEQTIQQFNNKQQPIHQRLLRTNYRVTDLNSVCVIDPVAFWHFIQRCFILCISIILGAALWKMLSPASPGEQLGFSVLAQGHCSCGGVQTCNLWVTNLGL